MTRQLIHSGCLRLNIPGTAVLGEIHDTTGVGDGILLTKPQFNRTHVGTQRRNVASTVTDIEVALGDVVLYAIETFC